MEDNLKNCDFKEDYNSKEGDVKEDDWKVDEVDSKEDNMQEYDFVKYRLYKLCYI